MTNTPTPSSSTAATASPTSRNDNFKVNRLLALMLVCFAIFSLFGFAPEDMDYYAGGISAVGFPHNPLGAAGAYLSWGLLSITGVAAYPMAILAGLTCFRRAFWRRGLKAINWEYWVSFILLWVSIAILCQTYPESIASLTQKLNLQGLSGGVLGMTLASPGVGWLHVLFNTFGTVLIAVCTMVACLWVIVVFDWQDVLAFLYQRALKPLFLRLFQKQSSNSPEEEPAIAPMESVQPEAPAPMPPMEPAPATSIPGGFNKRRGETGQAAGRPAQEVLTQQTPPPVVPQNRAPLRQMPLPMEEPRPAPSQPQSQVKAPAPPKQPVFTPPPLSEGGKYTLPDPSLYTPNNTTQQFSSSVEVEENRRNLQDLLDSFRIAAEVVNAVPGPQVTLFEIALERGVNVNSITSVESNIRVKFGTKNLRILTPIPGTTNIGIEIPNRTRYYVGAHELFHSQEWVSSKAAIPLMVGKTITGSAVVCNLLDAPHLLVAGGTSSGKSVCMNMLIQSMLLRFRPDELKLIMVDPKFLEFQPYEKLPHLMTPIINEPEKVVLMLRWLVGEMNRRYKIIAASGNLKNLLQFNQRDPANDLATEVDGQPIPAKMPLIVVIIDEVGDIMARAQKDVDKELSMLSSKARACGIHMIIATQRPDAKVITGVIKSNFLWRVALAVSDRTNSRIILDQSGAETLLGKGDLLFKDNSDIQRIQCGFSSNEDTTKIVQFCTAQAAPDFDTTLGESLDDENGGNGAAPDGRKGGAGGGNNAMPPADEEDSLVMRALEVLRISKRPTISYMQRQLGIGYNRAASLMDTLEDLGYVGPQPSSGMRDIYWDNFPADSNGYGMGMSEPEDEPYPPMEVLSDALPADEEPELAEEETTPPWEESLDVAEEAPQESLPTSGFNSRRGNG